ncbi:hypothetical protein D3C86_1560810 [compost metagenome]
MIEFSPRIWILIAPAPPGVEVTRTPGALPYKELAILGEAVLTIASDLIILVAYPIALFFLDCPNAVTVTPSSSLVAVSNLIFISSAAFTSTVLNPIELTTIVAPSFTEILNCPFSSVIAPTLAPFTLTVTPGTGIFALSVITPDIVLFCAFTP